MYYSFKNKETDEEFDLQMTISERDVYVQEHPEMEQVIKTMRIVDPAGIGITKPPSDFQKYVIGKMQKTVAGQTAIGTKRWGTIREW